MRHSMCSMLGVALLLGCCGAAAASTATRTHGLTQSEPPAWRHYAQLSLAAVESSLPLSGSLLGVQCDKNDPRNRRLLFGTSRQLDRGGASQSLRTMRPAIVKVAVEAQSTYAEFVLDIEARDTISLNEPIDVVAAFLTTEQYQLLQSAKSLTISAGGRSYWFTGHGSSSATKSLACNKVPAVPASRYIARTVERSTRPTLTPWSFTPRILAADPRKGRYLAFTSAVGFPESPLASFNFEIACHGNRLYASFVPGSVAMSVPSTASERVRQFNTSIDTDSNSAEVYRDGMEVASFSVEQGASGKGHMLTARELAALLSFDSIVVTTRDKSRTVEFTNKNGPQAISAVAEACGTQSH